MTPHMRDLIRAIAWDAQITGPVLEVGSYVESKQDHLNLRRSFPPGTPYLGTDVIPGPGVDLVVDLLDPGQMNGAYERIQPRAILCLYVLEHVWDIHAAAKALAALWLRNQESWLFVSTHQNQPYHGTEQYGDFWRITAPGMLRLMEEAGVGGTHVLVHADTSNPEDVLSIRQPLSMPWTPEKMGHSVAAVAAHWERYC